MGKRQRFPHLIVQLKRPSTTKLHNTTQDASAMSTKGIADVFFGSMLLSPRQKISSAVQDRLWRLLAPWPLGVFRYRLFRLYLSTDCTSMLNLPMSTHKKIRKENRACYFTSHLYRVSSTSLSPLLFTDWASDRTRSSWCSRNGHRDESHAPLL